MADHLINNIALIENNQKSEGWQEILFSALNKMKIKTEKLVVQRSGDNQLGGLYVYTFYVFSFHFKENHF